MKYIRTEKGIYKSDRKDIVIHEDYISNYEQIIYHTNEKILKQSDTIEELCDEFVFVGQDNMPILMETLQKCLERIKDLGLTNHKIYGAIWIQLSNSSCGLKPVVQANEKGELELL